MPCTAFLTPAAAVRTVRTARTARTSTRRGAVMCDVAARRRVVTFVTANKNKLREVREILHSTGAPDGVELVSRALDLPELQGDVAEVARAKAVEAGRRVGGPVLVEDTALEMRALGGLPGVYIKWFVAALGTHGLVRMLAGFDDKAACAVCTFAYAAGAPGETADDVLLFQGRTHGVIVDPRTKDDKPFGWDPLFQPNGEELTYAEMDKEAKNAISHRFRALEKVKAFLSDNVAPVRESK